MVDPPAAVEALLAGFPADHQAVLRQVRVALLDGLGTAAAVGERLAYGIPTVTVDGDNLVHYAGWTDHLAVYPAPTGDAALAEELAAYRSGKGTLRFDWGAVPLALVARVGAALLAERR